MTDKIKTDLKPDIENEVGSLYELVVTAGANANASVMLDKKSLTFNNKIRFLQTSMRSKLIKNRISRIVNDNKKDIFTVSGLLSALDAEEPEELET